MNDKFLRYEFKFVVPAETGHLIRNDMQRFMKPDLFAQTRNNNEYQIRSLYFDTDNYFWYFEKVTGVRKREKIRVRTYSFEKESEVPIFLEVKGRDNNYVKKDRISLSKDFLKFIIQGKELPLSLDGDENNVYGRHLFYKYKMNIKPTILVDYVRTPMVSKFDHEFRVTFDSALRVCKSRELFPEHSLWRKPIGDDFIIEIKFARSIPFWMTQIIRKYQLRRVSISKYCEGIESLGLCLYE